MNRNSSSGSTNSRRYSIIPRGGPALALGMVISASIVAVAYSHYAQVRERQTMRAGIERDKEMLRIKKQKLKQQQQQSAPDNSSTSTTDES